MRVFVLGTGRCGSVTFIKACEHISNFTAGHESRAGAIGGERLNYPSNHIEADNRLAWFLGGLHTTFSSEEVFYVHLRRDPAKVARSFHKRWDSSFHSSIIRAFGKGIIMNDGDLDPFEVCQFYVDTVTTNIEAFLADRQHMTIWLEDARPGFRRFWQTIGAEGRLNAALAEFSVRHNASRD